MHTRADAEVLLSALKGLPRLVGGRTDSQGAVSRARGLGKAVVPLRPIVQVRQAIDAMGPQVATICQMAGLPTPRVATICHHWIRNVAVFISGVARHVFGKKRQRPLITISGDAERLLAALPRLGKCAQVNAQARRGRPFLARAQATMATLEGLLPRLPSNATRLVSEMELRLPGGAEVPDPVGPQNSIDVMERKSAAAALGVKASTMANYRSGLKAALRYFCLLAERQKLPPVEDPAWVALLERLPEERAYERLRAFISWLASQGVAPAAVGPPQLDACLVERQAERGGSKQVSAARRVVDAWRSAASTVDGWPQVGRANPQPRQLSLNFDAYPAPLAQEAEKYLTDIGSPVDIFADDAIGKRNPVRPRTVETRRHGVRALFWGAFEGGIPMERLNHLRALLEQDILKASFKWHMTRKNLLADKKIDAQLMTFVATTYSIANYFGVEGDERPKLKTFLDKLKPKQQDGLIDRHERILDALKDPRTRAMLLHLPAELMKAARKLREGGSGKLGTRAPRPSEAAWLAGMAVAIEIELHAPLRLSDLAQLCLGHELRLSAANSSRWIGTLHVQRTSKTGKGIQFPLQPETIQLIREYIDDFRPLLRHASSLWLFPGEVSVAQPRAVSAFGTAISENIAQYVGLRVNPHAFRCIAGGIILEANPHAIDDLRAILGHATFETALRYYRRFSTRAAGVRLGQTIARLRRDTSHLVRQPRRPKPIDPKLIRPKPTHPKPRKPKEPRK